MTQSQEALLSSYGMNVQATIMRFGGNEALMMRLMNDFLEDTTFNELCDAMKAGDSEAMKLATHSLKGLTGNLGLTPLFESCTKLMDAMRQNDPCNTAAFFTDVKQQYDKTIRMITALG